MAASTFPMPGRRFVIAAVPYVWLVVFFFLPFLILLVHQFRGHGQRRQSLRSGTPKTGLLKLKYENCAFFAPARQTVPDSHR
jgi:putrescine transport system permease protein